jgi:hypothetical protein
MSLPISIRYKVDYMNKHAMNKTALMILGLLAASYVPAANAELAEINLIDPLDEPRGWCVDLFAHLTNAIPLGGFQGHSCFLDMGRGATQDQGFDVEMIKDQGKFRLAHFDMCMTLQEPKSGSYVALEPCVDEPAQKFKMNADGTIVPQSAPQLCLTLGDTTIPGGGRLARVGARPPKTNIDIPQIRRLTFDTCTAQSATLQRWQLRTTYARQKRTIPGRFLTAEEEKVEGPGT